MWALMVRPFFVMQASSVHEVELHLALLRLPVHDTDILVTISDPIGMRCGPRPSLRVP